MTDKFFTLQILSLSLFLASAVNAGELDPYYNLWFNGSRLMDIKIHQNIDVSNPNNQNIVSALIQDGVVYTVGDEKSIKGNFNVEKPYCLLTRLYTKPKDKDAKILAAGRHYQKMNVSIQRASPQGIKSYPSFHIFLGNSTKALSAVNANWDLQCSFGKSDADWSQLATYQNFKKIMTNDKGESLITIHSPAGSPKPRPQPSANR